MAKSPTEKETGTEVATRATTAVAMPSFMEGKAGRGTENIGASDIEVPRIKLMQSNSPELETYNDLKNGEFFHTITEEPLGKSIRVVPIYMDQQFILWNPRDSGGGILARAGDGIHWSPEDAEFKVKLDKKDGGLDVVWKTAKTVAASRLDQWGSSNPADPKSPPAATRMYNIVCAFPDNPDLPPAVVTLQRSSIKIARRFMAKMKVSRAPSYGMVFEMRSVEDKNAVGQKYNNFAFIGAGLVTNAEMFNYFEEQYEMFKKVGLNIRDIETLQEDDTPIDRADAGGANADSPKF